MDELLGPRKRVRSQYAPPEDEVLLELSSGGGASSVKPAKRRKQTLPPGSPPQPCLHAPKSPTHVQAPGWPALVVLEARIVEKIPVFAKQGGGKLSVANLRLAAEQYGGAEFDMRLRVAKSAIPREDLLAVLGKILDRDDWSKSWAGTDIRLDNPAALLVHSRRKKEVRVDPKPILTGVPLADGCAYHDALGKGLGMDEAAWAASDHQLLVFAQDRLPGIVQVFNSKCRDDKLAPLRGLPLLDFIVAEALGHRGLVAGMLFYLGGRQLAEVLRLAPAVGL